MFHIGDYVYVVSTRMGGIVTDVEHNFVEILANGNYYGFEQRELASCVNNGNVFSHAGGLLTVTKIERYILPILMVTPSLQ